MELAQRRSPTPPKSKFQRSNVSNPLSPSINLSNFMMEFKGAESWLESSSRIDSIIKRNLIHLGSQQSIPSTFYLQRCFASCSVLSIQSESLALWPSPILGELQFHELLHFTERSTSQAKVTLVRSTAAFTTSTDCPLSHSIGS